MTLTGWETVFFWVFSTTALIAALLTVMARNAVHSALFLISALISIAALFILLGSEFVGGVQILVYVGGVMVLFVFVIMLVNVSAEERGNERLFNDTPQIVASLIFSLLLAIALIYAINQAYKGMYDHDRAKLVQAGETRAATENEMTIAATGTMRLSRDTQNVGGSLYRYASLPFEIASVLLLVAIVGSVLLARTRKQEAASDDLAPDAEQIEQKAVGSA